MHVAGFDLRMAAVRHISHRAAHHIGTLPGQAAVRQTAAGVLEKAHVHIADDAERERMINTNFHQF